MHSGVYKGPPHGLSLKRLARFTLEGVYDVLTGQESEYISPDRIIWLESGGWMKISAQSEPDAESLEELFS